MDEPAVDRWTGPARLNIAAFLAAAVISTAAAQAGDAPVAVTVSVDDTAPGRVVPPGFAGLSLETCGDLVDCPAPGWTKLPAGTACPGGSYFCAANTGLVAAFRLISPHGHLRLGGDSSDFVPVIAVSPQVCRDLGSFVAATGWTVFYGLDAKAADPDAAARTAACVVGAAGTGRVVFQIGNEPSLATTYPPGQTNFQPWDHGGGAGAAAYLALWRRYHAAVSAAVPGAQFCGPDDVGQAGWWAAFAAGVGPDTLACFSMHLYPLGSGRNPTTTIANLTGLATDTGPPPAHSIAPARIAAAAGAVATGLPYYVTELGTAWDGGADLVANGLGSGLWTVDYGMQLAEGGFAGVMLHGTLAGPAIWAPARAPFYAPIFDDAGVQVFAGFYGLMILAQMEGGRLLPARYPGRRPNAPADRPGPIDVAGYGVRGADGLTRIIAVNRDLERTAAVTLGQTSAFATASVHLLTGRGCADIDGVTYAGGQVSTAGTITLVPLTVARGASFALPACSVALAVLH